MDKINSRQKGAAGEREAAAFLNSLGFTARRSVQNGVTDGRDIVVDDLPNLYFEVKRDQKVDIGTKPLMDACYQASTKAEAYGANGEWCVLWRRNGGKWRVTFIDDKCGMVTVHRNEDIRACLKMLNTKGGAEK